MRRRTVAHEFVEYVPDDLKEGIVYVCIQFGTAVHRCCCGCGSKVVTPLSPADWTLIFNGETISLDPSIGNWSFPCQSHYWIQQNRVVWDRRWSQEEIAAGRTDDQKAQGAYLRQSSGSKERLEGADQKSERSSVAILWAKLKIWFRER
jgi:Family of unknown function (DUF6527)